MRRHIHGAIGRFLGCIPVERPRDLAKQGKGTIISIKEGVLKVEKQFFFHRNFVMTTLTKNQKGKDTEFTT